MRTGNGGGAGGGAVEGAGPTSRKKLSPCTARRTSPGRAGEYLLDASVSSCRKTGGGSSSSVTCQLA